MTKSRSRVAIFVVGLSAPVAVVMGIGLASAGADPVTTSDVTHSPSDALQCAKTGDPRFVAVSRDVAAPDPSSGTLPDGPTTNDAATSFLDHFYPKLSTSPRDDRAATADYPERIIVTSNGAATAVLVPHPVGGGFDISDFYVCASTASSGGGSN